jgi:hypothetical protein
LHIQLSSVQWKWRCTILETTWGLDTNILEQRYQISTVRSVLFCIIMWRHVVTLYQCFRTTYWSHMIRCPKMSVNNYHITLHNILEECRSHQHCGGSLKSTNGLQLNAINLKLVCQNMYTARQTGILCSSKCNSMSQCQFPAKYGILTRLLPGDQPWLDS